MKRLDPRAKVTGAAQYTCDIRLPGMAYVALVESPVAHARITALRLDQALRRDAHYQPQFVNYPMKIQELTLNLTDADMANVRKLIRRGQGSDPEDAIRSAVMTLYTRLRTPQILPEALDAEGT